MAEKLTTLERQSAATAVCTVQDCIKQYGRPEMVLVVAVTLEGHAAGNAIWESTWTDLPTDTIQHAANELIEACAAKREAVRQKQQDQGLLGEQGIEGRDVLA